MILSTIELDKVEAIIITKMTYHVHTPTKILYLQKRCVPNLCYKPSIHIPLYMIYVHRLTSAAVEGYRGLVTSA